MNSETRSRRTGITVTGSGAAAASIDQVTVTLSVSVVRTDAGEAFQAAANTATRVLAILADDGADSRSVRTANLTFGPQFDMRTNREVLTGYRAGQSLVVHLAGLAGLERMLTDVALQGGAGVRIEGVSLTPSDPTAALREARAAAFADAMAKAAQLADLAGRLLGEISWIDEHPWDSGRGQAVGMGFSRASRIDMPIAAGEAAVTASVTVHWEFASD